MAREHALKSSRLHVDVVSLHSKFTGFEKSIPPTSKPPQKVVQRNRSIEPNDIVRRKKNIPNTHSPPHPPPSSRKVTREALLLSPQLLIVGQRVRLHLRLVRRDHFFPAVLALHRRKTVQISFLKLAYAPSLGNVH